MQRTKSVIRTRSGNGTSNDNVMVVVEAEGYFRVCVLGCFLLVLLCLLLHNLLCVVSYRCVFEKHSEVSRRTSCERTGLSMHV